MKFEEIQAEWAKDSVIDKEDPSPLSVDQLHEKYWKYMESYRMRMIAMQRDYDTMIAEKEQFFLNPTNEVSKEKNWDYPIKVAIKNNKETQVRIPKTEIKAFLAKDQDLLALKHRMSIVELRVEFITDVIKRIHNRSFLINAHIEWVKFKNGIGG